MVDLEPHRGVDRVVILDAEAGAAEGDAERAVGAAVEAEAGVLALPHRPHVADPRRGDHQPHPGVAHPERREPAQLLGELEAEADAADDGVDALGPSQVLGAEDRSRVGGEGLAERVEVLGPQREPGGGAMAAEAEQVLGAGLERREQVEAGNAAARAAPAPLAVERDDHDRAVVALDQARGDDADDAGVPALAGQDQPRRLAQMIGQLTPRRLGGGVDLALGRDAARSSPASAPPRSPRPAPSSSRQHQLDPGIGPVEPAGGVDPRRQPERQIALVEPSRLAFRGRHQRPQPNPARPPHLRQPAPDQRPVLAHQTAPRRRPWPGRPGRGRVASAASAAAVALQSGDPCPTRSQGRCELPGDRRAAERRRTGSC